MCDVIVKCAVRPLTLVDMWKWDDVELKNDELAMIKVQNKKAIRSRVVDPLHWREKQRGSDYRICEIIPWYRGLDRTTSQWNAPHHPGG